MKKGLILALVLTICLFAGSTNDTSKDAIMDTSSYPETEAEFNINYLDKTKTEYYNKDRDIDRIYDMYAKLDENKDTLQYEYSNECSYFTESQLLSSSHNHEDEHEDKDKSNSNEKKYQTILSQYSFSSNLTPINATFDDAYVYVNKVLPDDIKKVDEKFNTETGIVYIFYTSSKGNFVACLNKEIDSIENGEYIYSDKYVCGISYLIEMS